MVILVMESMSSHVCVYIVALCEGMGSIVGLYLGIWCVCVGCVRETNEEDDCVDFVCSSMEVCVYVCEVCVCMGSVCICIEEMCICVLSISWFMRW